MRHPIRLVTFLIGVWFGGLLLIAVAVPTGFQTTNSMLESPPSAVSELVNKAGAENVRQVFQQQASETTRNLLYSWGWVQLGLAVVLLGFLVFGTPVGRISIGLGLVMFILAAWMKMRLIPRMMDLSRTLDYEKGADVSAGGLYQIFGAFEGAIVILGAVLLGRFLYRTRGPGLHSRADTH